jgi:hypothetical protein
VHVLACAYGIAITVVDSRVDPGDAATVVMPCALPLEAAAAKPPHVGNLSASLFVVGLNLHQNHYMLLAHDDQLDTSPLFHHHQGERHCNCQLSESLMRWVDARPDPVPAPPAAAADDGLWHYTTGPEAKKISDTWAAQLPEVASGSSPEPTVRARRGPEKKTDLKLLAVVMKPGGQQQYDPVALSTFRCLEVATKGSHGRWIKQLYHAGRMLQGKAGEDDREPRVFVEDVFLPASGKRKISGHYVLTAKLSMGPLHDRARWVTFELFPLFIGKESKVPRFNTSEPPTLLSAEHMKAVARMSPDALTFLFEAICGVRHLDILSRGVGLTPAAMRPMPLLDLTRGTEQVHRSIDASADLRRHVLVVAHLSYQVLELRAQQERDKNALTELHSAKLLVDNALEKTTRKTPDSDVPGKPCTKKVCTAFTKTHKDCASKADQTKHQRSHEAHMSCLTSAMQQKNATDVTSLRATLLEKNALISELRKDLAAAQQTQTKEGSQSLELNVVAYNAVISNFATSAKLLMPDARASVQPTTPPTQPVAPPPTQPPTPAPASYSISELKELKGLWHT